MSKDTLDMGTVFDRPESSNENSPPTSEGLASAADAPASPNDVVGHAESSPGAGALPLKDDDPDFGEVEPAPGAGAPEFYELTWETMELPSEGALAEVLYQFNVIEEGPEYIDGMPINGRTKPSVLDWAAINECDYDIPFRKAASAMLTILRARQLGKRAGQLGNLHGPPDPNERIDLPRPPLRLEPTEELLPEGFDWAIVELFGHVRHVARISEVEKYGAKMCRIDVPTMHEGKVLSWTTCFVGGSSIYRLTPTDWATVRRPF